MSDQQERAFPMRSIPKRPAQQPTQLPSPPKRPFLTSKPIQPISMDDTEQPPQTPTPSSDQADEVDHRSLLADVVTVKREALRLKASPEKSPYPAVVIRNISQVQNSSHPRASLGSQSVAIPYPATISNRKARKWSLFDWITSFTFFK